MLRHSPCWPLALPTQHVRWLKQRRAARNWVTYSNTIEGPSDPEEKSVSPRAHCADRDRAEKVSLWSGTTGSGRPLRGLWLKNTSPLTFEAEALASWKTKCSLRRIDGPNQIRRTSAHFVCDGPRAPGRSVKEQPTAARHASEDFERRAHASERVAWAGRFMWREIKTASHARW